MPKIFPGVPCHSLTTSNLPRHLHSQLTTFLSVFGVTCTSEPSQLTTSPSVFGDVYTRAGMNFGLSSSQLCPSLLAPLCPQCCSLHVSTPLISSALVTDVSVLRLYIALVQHNVPLNRNTSPTPQRTHLTSRPRHKQHTNKGWRSDLMPFWASGAHPWVLAGHPQYTGAHHGGEAVDDPTVTARARRETSPTGVGTQRISHTLPFFRSFFSQLLFVSIFYFLYFLLILSCFPALSSHSFLSSFPFFVGVQHAGSQH